MAVSSGRVANREASQQSVSSLLRTTTRRPVLTEAAVDGAQRARCYFPLGRALCFPEEG